MKTHPRLQAARAETRAAEQDIKEQRSGFFPTLSVNGRAGRIEDNNDTTRGTTGGAASSWLGEGNVALTQPVFDGFGTWNRYKAAKERMQSSEFDASGDADDISLKAIRSHLNVMRTRELFAQADTYFKSLVGYRDRIKLMVDEGASDASELAQANEMMAMAETSKTNYRQLMNEAEAEYRESTGDDADKKLDLGVVAFDNIIPKDINAAIALGVAENPKMQSAKKAMESYAFDSKAERSALMPHLDAELSYLKRDQNDDLSGEATSAQAMMKMSWNFSTGGGQSARIQKSLERREQAQASAMETARAIEKDVRQRFAQLSTADQLFKLAVDREEANKELLDQYEVQFEGGKRTIFQVMGVEGRVFDARKARIESYYSKQLSKFSLLADVGRLGESLGLKVAANVPPPAVAKDESLNMTAAPVAKVSSEQPAKPAVPKQK